MKLPKNTQALQIVFTEGSHEYTYYTKREWIVTLVPGDLVLVPVYDNQLSLTSLRVGRFVRFTSLKELDSNISYRYIVGVIPDSMLKRYYHEIQQGEPIANIV